MAVHTYECLFLLDPNRSSADWDGVMKQANGILQRHGGKILHTQPWGEPKLAYPIKKFRKGSYLLTYFEAESTSIPKMEHDCRLNDTILRQMVIKLHPQIAKETLDHYTKQGGEKGSRSMTPPIPVPVGDYDY